MQIRNMTLNDYNEVDRLMAQVHQLHVNGRPDLYIDVDHIYSYEQFKEMVENEDMITILAEE
ncbi:MAG: GNAT family N-acetyltransferase, partial [Lachnospiraceae bacterium]|nr:GNAT family N-acetyltransferase [Lachnospiraceae bacterium]